MTDDEVIAVALRVMAAKQRDAGLPFGRALALAEVYAARAAEIEAVSSVDPAGFEVVESMLVRDVAALLDVSEQAVTQALRRRRLRGVQLPDRTWRVDRAHVEELIAKETG